MKGSVNGTKLVRLLEAGLRSLETQFEELNRINVFPVPDGDTGTNMVHTLRFTLERLPRSSTSSLDSVTAAIEENALYAARGNSGVILAAFLRGLCASLSGREAASVGNLAEAFHEGARAARAAVDRPVEGTMLTVMADSAAAGLAATTKTVDESELLEEMAAAAERSLIETPRLLPELGNAGVIDAGAAGFLAVLQGMASHREGDRQQPDGGDSRPMQAPPPGGEARPTRRDFASRYGYCTELMVASTNLDRTKLRNDLARLGDSLLVIGTKRLLRIHVHAADPGGVISVCQRHGSLHEVSIQNMDDQAARQREGALTRPAEARKPGPVIVAVADGEGFAEIFRSLGAYVVQLTDGEGPSSLLDRARKLMADTVVVLPNREERLFGLRRLLDSARLGERDDGRIRVAVTRNMGEGVAALFEWDPERSIDETLERMNRAACNLVTVEVACEGVEYVARIGGEKVGPFGSLEALARSFAGSRGRAAELCTVYYGDAADSESTDAVTSALQTALPRSRIEVHYGGQPETLFLISFE